MFPNHGLSSQTVRRKGNVSSATPEPEGSGDLSISCDMSRVGKELNRNFPVDKKNGSKSQGAKVKRCGGYGAREAS
jgi:hypothetical protein